MCERKISPIRVPVHVRLPKPMRGKGLKSGSSPETASEKSPKDFIAVRPSEARFVLRLFRRLCVCFRPSPAKVFVPPFEPVGKILAKGQINRKVRKTLVLDLDETLVHSSFSKTESPDAMIVMPVDGIITPVYVTYRPGLKELLAAVSKLYEIIVFTASLPSYANPLLDIIDTEGVIEQRFFRESCKHINETYIKDLRLLGKDLSKVVIVDNCPDSYTFQPHNAIPISSFFGDKQDRELFKLIPLLQEVAQVTDVRDTLNQTMDQSNSFYPREQESGVTSGTVGDLRDSSLRPVN